MAPPNPPSQGVDGCMGGVLEWVWLGCFQGCCRQLSQVGIRMAAAGTLPWAHRVPPQPFAITTHLSKRSWARTAPPEPPSSHSLCSKQTLVRNGPQPTLPPPCCLPAHFPSCRGNINCDGVCLMVFLPSAPGGRRGQSGVWLGQCQTVLTGRFSDDRLHGDEDAEAMGCCLVPWQPQAVGKGCYPHLAVGKLRHQLPVGRSHRKCSCPGHSPAAAGAGSCGKRGRPTQPDTGQRAPKTPRKPLQWRTSGLTALSATAE